MSTPYRDAPDELGALVSVHRDGSDRFLMAALVVVGIGASVAFAAIEQWGQLGGAIAATGLGVVLLRRRRREAAGSIALHENGLVQVALGKTTRIFFDDVVSITSERTKSVRSGVETDRHRVAARDGSAITFVNLSTARAGDLLAAIEARVLPRVRTEALQAFDRGETVAFGPFSLDEAGIRAGDGASIPWMDVRAVSAEGGMVHIRGEGDRSLESRGASLIPNLAVFVEMVTLAAEQAGPSKKVTTARRESAAGSD